MSLTKSNNVNVVNNCNHQDENTSSSTCSNIDLNVNEIQGAVLISNSTDIINLSQYDNIFEINYQNVSTRNHFNKSINIYFGLNFRLINCKL